MEQGKGRIGMKSIVRRSPRVPWPMYLIALSLVPACAAPPQYRPRLIRPVHHRLLPKHATPYADLAQAVEQPGGATPDRLLEVSKRAAKAGLAAKDHPDEAVAAFRDSAAYAVFALAMAAPDDARAREKAIDRHNHAVEQLLLAAGAGEEKRIDPAWKSRLEGALIELAPSGPTLSVIPNDEVWIARNSKTDNLERIEQAGLGVPLVSVSHFPDREAEPERFLPKDLELPATAVVEPLGPLEGGAWRLQPVRLNLIDPKHEQHLTLPGSPCRIPLAYDLTTPLAHQFLSRPLLQFSWIGLLQPDRANLPSGLLMQEPHQPGKIPVLFIHGLFSNPGAWLRMVNVLQADPVLRERYEFWFAFYPTGAPFASSALRLRKELDALRNSIDPGHADPALDQMVLVGHSLGGVISRQMIQSSGKELEKGLFTVPMEQVKMSDETRQVLSELLYFEPVPSVRRVIFLAAPHRGSGVANQFIGRFTDSLVRPPTRLSELHAEVVALNGRKVLTPFFRRKPPSSVDNLKPDSPILSALSRLPMKPDVPYHSIIATLTPEAPQRFWSDGVVPYWSAHLDGAQSEHIIRYSHFANEPLSAAEEVHRLLRLHLDELR